MIMRAACGIHCGDLNAALETYDLMSRWGQKQGSFAICCWVVGPYFPKKPFDMIYCRYPNDELFFWKSKLVFGKWLWGDFVGKHFSILTISPRKFFTHATPTLFNAGTPHPQMSSCFLLKMQGDSIDGIYDTLKQCAVISKSAGGIGVAATWLRSRRRDVVLNQGLPVCWGNSQLKASPTEVSNIRASGSYIRGTNGWSNGLVPMLRNFNETARYVDQGPGFVNSMLYYMNMY